MRRFKERLQSNKKQIILNMLIISTLSILIGAGVYMLTKKPTSEPVITYSTNEPDESKASANNYTWNGALDEPKKIRIEKIGVDSFVQKAGVDQNKKIAVPTNVHLAGWFKDSQKPGQKGLSIISGHVTGRRSDGVFKQLEKLEKNDPFEIEVGDGTIKKYKVISTVKVSEADSPNYVFSQDPSVKSQVNVVTCGGEFDTQAEQYKDRIIVSGELVE